MAASASRITPWIRAESETRFSLYWAGISSVPWRQQERRWFSRFLELFVCSVEQTGLMPCFFIETRAIYAHCLKTFLKEAADLRAFSVILRKPWEPLPEEFSEDEADKLRRGEKTFALDNYLGGMAQWFQRFRPAQVIPAYCGLGGATVLFLPPDPAISPPALDFPPGVKRSPHFRELFALADPVEELRSMMLLKHKALAALKKAFSRGAEDNVLVQSVPVLVPRLGSREFFSLEQEVLDALFEASPFYLAESPEDRGIVLASARPIDGMLAALVEAVNAELAGAGRKDTIQ